MSLKPILYDWGGLNVWLFHIINNIQGDLWGQFMLLGTSLAAHENFLYYLAGLTVIAAICLKRGPKTKWPYYFGVLAVFVIGYYLDELLIVALKNWFDFPRPLLALPPDTVHVLGEPKLHYSLPSGHTAFATLLVASAWPLLGTKGRITAMLFVLWVGVSRMALGAHFPADVLAGFLVSLIVCSAVWWLFIRAVNTRFKIVGK